MEGTSISAKTLHSSALSYASVQQSKEKNQLETESKVPESSNEVIIAQLEKAVEEINQKLAPTFVSVRFQLHEKSHTYFAQVVNADTNEVIREVPPEKLLDMHAEMERLTGLIVDQKM
ncbi:flagellar protein FlaG [Priestia flexa]|jgi:flagellar protein FlaG|uniref:Flagellar protein FlaG n=1 Tax=Priestia flexa TaxID=86664 RepID=A0A8I1MIJ4_9BACI|nr:flagellar protein FlaG [Priestia flexa]MBN8252991.1 flagellar protein FlaG [Priestia flexa]UIR29834.1 flagellar protein FlaG [Priestia flexa]